MTGHLQSRQANTVTNYGQPHMGPTPSNSAREHPTAQQSPSIKAVPHAPQPRMPLDTSCAENKRATSAEHALTCTNTVTSLLGARS